MEAYLPPPSGRLVQKKDKALYIVVLNCLWFAVMLGFAMDFKLVRTGYVAHNSSPLDMASYFMIEDDPSTKVYIILDRVFYTLAMSLADGLLVRQK